MSNDSSSSGGLSAIKKLQQSEIMELERLRKENDELKEAIANSARNNSGSGSSNKKENDVAPMDTSSQQDVAHLQRLLEEKQGMLDAVTTKHSRVLTMFNDYIEKYRRIVLLLTGYSVSFEGFFFLKFFCFFAGFFFFFFR